MTNGRRSRLVVRTAVGLACIAALALLGAPPAASTELRGAVQASGATRPGAGAPHSGGAVLTRREGHPVALVRMDSGALVARTRTDGLGRFVFRDVPPGSYRLVIGFPTPLRELVIDVPDGIVLELPPIVLPAGP
jgi:hypothetical protein